MEDIPVNYNGLVVIGDHPVTKDSTLPFDNAPYGTLAKLLRSSGLSIEATGKAVACPVYPENNGAIITEEYSALAYKNVERLKKLFGGLRPKAVLLVGRQTLRFFKPGCDGVDDERGAPFRWQYGDTPADSVTCICTYHPSELYREWHNCVLVEADIAKLVGYMATPWVMPVYEINYLPSFKDCIDFLRWALDKKPPMSIDIETQHSVKGKYSAMSCIGFGINTRKAFVIPFVRDNHTPYFTFEEELQIWRILARVLEDLQLGGQHAVHYDHWWLAYYAKINANIVFDTEFAHWEVYTEMPKALSFQNSLYCHNPYWKNVLGDARSGKIPRSEEFRYCGLDNIICLQSAYAIKKEMSELPPAVTAHYKFNIRLSRVFQYMSLRGVTLDKGLLDSRLVTLRKQYEDDEQRFHDTTKQKINVGSSKQMKKWLYEDLKLPVRTKLVTLDDGTKEDRETADFLSLAYMAREYPTLEGLMLAANLRKLKKRISSLNAIECGPINDIYWNFNCVGTETGRAAGYKPNNDLGVQPQNPDKRDRDLFLPGPVDMVDPWVWLKADLEGADAWTVAAQLDVLGDNTMFEDLKAGLKPAFILALAYTFGHHLVSADRSELKRLQMEHKAFFKTTAGKQNYDTCKAVSHGCLTADAEVLTPTGWIKISDYRGQEIVTVDENLNSFLAKPLDYVNYPYIGEMVHFEGSTIDMLVTGDHTVPYLASSGRVKKTSALQAFDIKANRLPMGTSYYYSEETRKFSDNQIRLAAAYHSDGSKNEYGKVKFHFAKKRKFDRLLELLENSSVPYTTSFHPDQTFSVTLADHEDSDLLRTWFKTELQWDLLKLSWIQMRIYVEEALYWDGYKYENSETGGQFSSAVKRNVEIMHTMCYLCNKGSTFQKDRVSGFGSNIYCITINNRTNAAMQSLSRKKFMVENLPVYCFTTCTGMFLVRRNGKVFVTGNTNYMMQAPTMHMTIFSKSKAELFVPIPECEKLRLLYLKRYHGLTGLYNYIPTLINNDGFLDCPSGLRRVFFGRADNHRTRVGLALIPQNNTANATNTCLHRLYYSSYNRGVDGRSLLLQPLNQVHDEAALAFRQSDLDKARVNFSNACHLTSSVWGKEFVIPFDTNIGPNWGTCKVPFYSE